MTCRGESVGAIRASIRIRVRLQSR